MRRKWYWLALFFTSCRAPLPQLAQMQQTMDQIQGSVEQMVAVQKHLLASSSDVDDLLKQLKAQNAASRRLLTLMEKEEVLARLTERLNFSIERDTVKMAQSFQKQGELNKKIAAHTEGVAAAFQALEKNNAALLEKIKRQAAAVP